MNKRGWLRIVEAFIAVFIIISISLLVINKGYIERRDISEKVYDAEVQMLQEVIDNYGKNIGSGEVIDDINEKLVKERKPEYLDCKIQYLEEGSKWYPYETKEEEEFLAKKDIYVQTLPILDENNEGNDLLVRVVCWLN